jgi:hypothetical protein
MEKHILIILANAKEGQEDELNRWYDERHLDDILGLGAFSSGQRFKFDDTYDLGSVSPHKYLAIYEVPEGKLEEAYEALLFTGAERAEALAAGREPRVPDSDALADGPFVWFFTTITERREPKTSHDQS